MTNHLVGQARPSQMLWSYGPGALIDLPNLSVITMGTDQWNADYCPPINESRLLNAVRAALGPQVDRLRMAPFAANPSADPFSAEAKIGVPVKPFPRWLRCIKCGLLAEFDSGLFEIRPNPFRPERTHFRHSNCDKGVKYADAVPARFLTACLHGHLDDFPWHWFVHSGSSKCRGPLRFFERGASLQTENLWVKCDNCDTAKSLVHAFGQSAEDHLPGCRGRHPHLDLFEECEAELTTILLGASNGWFPVVLSTLAIPLADDQLSQLVQDGWEYFLEAESIEEVRVIVRTLIRSNGLPGIDNWEVAEIWNAICTIRDNTDDVVVSEVDIKKPEWEVLVADNPPKDWPHFRSSTQAAPSDYSEVISRVVLLERLREVNALIGYTRVETLDEFEDPHQQVTMGALCKGRPEWVPASEVHGEGIFIQFNESAVESWENRLSLIRREERLEAGHRAWRTARKLDPNVSSPGMRYTMLHTLAHLLIRELALESGYNAASIRERIYATSPEDGSMAGILVYTAAADSDGTLGGLVELGKTDSLGRLITQALDRARVCSSDPLCAEHDPGRDRSLHLAACHSCSFVPETSCERGNHYLDRALLVDTLEDTDAAFFASTLS